MAAADRLESMRRLAPLVLLGVVVAGCGGTKTVTVTTTSTVTRTVTTTPAETTALRVYFLRDGKVAPVARDVPKTEAVARAALDELLAGPTSGEIADGIVSALPLSAKLTSLSVSDGVARVAMTGADTVETFGEVVYTLTQFPTVNKVVLNGRELTRRGLEDVTPAILVESPLPYARVSSPLQVTGTANTFEATFEYALVDANGKVLASHFVTATSGSGTRGTFDFTVRFASPGGQGKLVVFERSAENGSRIHQVEIPLVFGP